MNKYIYIIGVLMFSACHPKPKTETASAVKTAGLANPAPVIKEVTITPGANMSDIGNTYQLMGMEIKDDVLTLNVEYSGGCKEHTWELISNGSYAKSLPPQITVCLKHNNHEDACRRLTMGPISFNISKLKHAGNNELIIKCGEQQASYKY